MNELILHCDKVLKLIDEGYPNQRQYSGIIKKIYDLTEKIYLDAKNGILTEKKIDLKSIARQFVDDTTHFDSPILEELVAIDTEIRELRRDENGE